MTLCASETGRSAQRPRPIDRMLREQAEGILDGSYDFIASPIFNRRGVEGRLMDGEAEPELPPVAWYQPTMRDAALEKTPNASRLMTADQEKLMFHRLNFSKKRLQELQETVRRDGLTAALAEETIQWHRRLEHYRDYLVRANLALVLAMAKRARPEQVDFAELVSEGNLALLRTVDKFDADRGFKFSTYACRAILKAFFRASMNMARHRSRFPVEFSSEFEASNWSDQRRASIEEECVDEVKTIVNCNLADLSTVEQTVIRLRFNWREEEEAPLTLLEVGQIIGLTKERVRQIQKQAMGKIRRIMDGGRPWQGGPASESSQLAGFSRTDICGTP